MDKVNSLQLASTNDLIDELKDRHEDIVMCCSRPEKAGNDVQELRYEYRGDWLKCLGLLDYAKRNIIEANLPEIEDE